jgi:preprotein translocase subunit YajC
MTISIAALLQTPQGGGGSALGMLAVQFVLIGAIFYFLILRPQQKQRQKHDEALRQLKKGDEVVTAGGLVGKVIHVREAVVDGTPKKTMEDRVTVETGEARVVVERGRIVKIAGVSSAPLPRAGADAK